MWDNENDLDLHCETPAGEHIWYGNKKASCGGHLDIDQNAHEDDSTVTPIENIFWPKPPPGHYKFWVEAVDMDRQCGQTPYTVRLTYGEHKKEQRWETIEEDDEVPAFMLDVHEEGEPAGDATAVELDPNLLRLHVMGTLLTTSLVL
eukprot:SAG25_NODE_921_length_4754_cov_3.223416_3_plen_147_part_00